jgi:ABC-2 type transport system ATP-binding protein
VLHQPDFLILDEPFTGFDPVNAMLIRDEILQLNKQGTTILFSTHRMESVEQLCSNLVMIHKSKVVLEGTPREIRSRYRTMEFIAELDHFKPDAFHHELISSEEPMAGRTKLHIRWNNDESPNTLIQSLLQAGTLVHFEESIPGLDQIFVKVVEG